MREPHGAAKLSTVSFKFNENFQRPAKRLGSWFAGEHQESSIVMILRAAFFIGLVALLMPHEPDIGLGRPLAGIGPLSPDAVLSVPGLSQAEQFCSFCAGAGHLHLPALNMPLNTPLSTQVMSLRIGDRSLSDVKADIAAAVKTREGGR